MKIRAEHGDIQDIRIAQILPLSPGWWLDGHDRCPAIALVEFTDNNGEVWQDILPLNEDLTVRFPDDADWMYVTNYYGDNKEFLTYKNPAHDPAPGIFS